MVGLIFWATVALIGQQSSVRSENARRADFEAAAKSATTAREAGNAGEAIREYERALGINPRWEEGLWYLGTLLYDANRYSEATFAFQKLVEGAPDAAPAWDFLGLCEFETKDYENSLMHLEKGQALGDTDDPDTARVARYHLALLRIRNGDFERAVATLSAGIGEGEVAPPIKTALGLAMLRVPLLPNEIDPSRDALVSAAGEVAAAIAQNNPAKALAAFPALITAYPDTPYLHYAYGKTLASAARDEESLKQQGDEARISPRDALPWIEISQLQLHLQHPQEALHAAEQAVQLAPDSFASHKALADALQTLGRKQKSTEERAVADKLATERSVREERMVSLYSNHTEASPSMQAVSPLTAESGSIGFEELSRRATAAQAAGKADLAIKNYQQALQLRPNWDDGRWNLAQLFYASARYPEAISELRTWVERQPNVGTAWALLGLCEFEVKDYGNAFIHLQRGEQLGFGGSREAEGLARYHLALLQNRNGQFDDATETLLPGTRTGTPATKVVIALGLAFLHMPQLPNQLDDSQVNLAQSAGEIAVLLQNSQYDQAYPRFEARLKEYPAVPFLHYQYGTALAALSQFDEAEAQFRAETQISPRSELPFVGMASLALKRYRPAEAMPSAQRAVQLASDSAEAHYVLGRAYLELDQNEQAVHEFEAAGKLAPGMPEVHFNLAKAYAKAKLPEKAEQERATFARLNALAEERRSHSGNQAYGASHDAR
jgi:tetratricopeptide (TPR) repeat protein